MVQKSGYECKECGFTVPAEPDDHFYVTNDCGERIPCEAHREHEVIAQVLGIGEEALCACSWNPLARDVPVDLLEERIGYESQCICFHCFAVFGLDLRRDMRICPSCGSQEVKTRLETEGLPCPRCKEGRIGHPSARDGSVGAHG